MIQACISLDTDWASDEIIEFVSGKFISRNVKSTWFITHESAAISKLLRKPELFEIGIHPNFLPGSSHGKTPEEVLDFLLKIVPDARIMRTHCLHQSTPLFHLILEKYPQIQADISLLLPDLKDVVSHKLYLLLKSRERHITRIPFIWEDDLEMLSPDRNFRFASDRFSGTGLKIFNFHPVHVALNSRNFQEYDDLKRMKPVQSVSLKECLQLREKSAEGTEDFLNGLLGATAEVEFLHIRDVLRLH